MAALTREQRIQENLNLISRYKTDINLVTFLQDIGFDIDRKKSSRGWPVLKEASTGRVLLVHRNERNGEYMFRNPHNNEDTGNIIKLAAEVYRLDLSSKEGWNDLHQKLGEKIGNVYFTKHEVVSPIGPTIKDKIKEGPAAVSAYFKLKPLTDTDYLVNDRKLSLSTVLSPEFTGKILNRAFNDKGKKPEGNDPGRPPSSGINTTFPLENENGMIAVMNRHSSGWNQIVGSKEDAIWVSNFNPSVKPKEFIVAESPINCLSYHELFPPKNDFERVYIATAGQPSGTQHLTIQKLINVYKPELLIMGNDNDPSGIRFNINMMSRLTMPEQPKTGFTMQINSAQHSNTFIVEFDPRALLKESGKTADQIKDRLNEVLNRGFPEDAPKAKITLITGRPDLVQIRADFSPIRSLLVRTENLVKEFKQSGKFVEIKRSIENDFNDDLKIKAEKLANKIPDPRRDMLKKLGPSPKGIPTLPSAKELNPTPAKKKPVPVPAVIDKKAEKKDNLSKTTKIGTKEMKEKTDKTEKISPKQRIPK